MRTIEKSLLVYLLLAFFVAACVGCNDDSSSNQQSDDDFDDDVADDDLTDDDLTDDDLTDDDLADDDSLDDDSIDDDTADDDTQPEDPYAAMAPSGKTVDELLAISSHINRGTAYSWTREFEIEKLGQAGVGMLRTDFSWSRIEPNNDDWQFDGYDTMVDLCGEAGIEVDALLDYGVDWAMPGGSHDEIDPADWADFSGHVAEHFADRIDLYEIWNEENTSRFWKPHPNPAHYGELLKAGYQAIHENDPQATVLWGGLSSWDIHIFLQNGIWNFLLRVHDQHPDICDYFDAMAIHPYTALQQPNPEFTLDLSFWVYPNLADSIDHARDLLTEIGCGDKPIYLTEIGWPHYFLGLQRQAAYLPRSVMLAAGREVEYYYWYTFWDGAGGSTPPTEDTFGLFTWPGNDPVEKPAYQALMGIHQLLGEASYAGDLAAALGWEMSQYALAFADDDGWWTVGLWHSEAVMSAQIPVTVPLHPNSNGAWELYDQEGILIDSGTAPEMEVDLDLRGTVVYLRFQVIE